MVLSYQSVCSKKSLQSLKSPLMVITTRITPPLNWISNQLHRRPLSKFPNIHSAKLQIEFFSLDKFDSTFAIWLGKFLKQIWPEDLGILDPFYGRWTFSHSFNLTERE